MRYNMKKITYFLIALLLCAAFVGTASAWNSNTNAIINPSGSLMPGDSVSGSMTIKYLKDTNVYQVQMYTELTSAVWTGTLTYVDGTPITEFPAGKKVIDGYPLSGLQNDVILTIYLDGKVPENKAGNEITVMRVEEITSSSSVVSTYSAPKQTVYNPADIPKQITQVESGIAALNAEVTEIAKLGVDVSAAIAKLDAAEEDLKSARNAGSNDVETATKELLSASSALVDAEKATVNSILEKTKSNLDQIGQNIANLNAKGWTTDSRVILLSTEKQTTQNLYNTVKSAYDASASAVSAATKTQATDALKGSSTTLSSSTTLWEEAQKGVIGNIGPYLMYIIIGVVAVIIIVGAVLFIRSRNGDDWDELG